MPKGNLVLVALALILIVIIFLAPHLAWRMRAFFLLPTADIESVATENLVLKAELAKLGNIKSQPPENAANYIRAVVLSRYPMNFKNEFFVDAGTTQGVEDGKAVVFGGVLVGRINKVFDDTSLVETVFNSDFQTAVRVGNFAVDALLRGGLTPEATLIPLRAKIAQGDVVYSASPDFPYALPLAVVKEIRNSEDNLFREATLEFSYDINEIRTIFVDTGGY